MCFYQQGKEIVMVFAAFYLPQLRRQPGSSPEAYGVAIMVAGKKEVKPPGLRPAEEAYLFAGHQRQQIFQTAKLEPHPAPFR